MQETITDVQQVDTFHLVTQTDLKDSLDRINDKMLHLLCATVIFNTGLAMGLAILIAAFS